MLLLLGKHFNPILILVLFKMNFLFSTNYLLLTEYLNTTSEKFFRRSKM